MSSRGATARGGGVGVGFRGLDALGLERVGGGGARTVRRAGGWLRFAGGAADGCGGGVAESRVDEGRAGRGADGDAEGRADEGADDDERA